MPRAAAPPLARTRPNIRTMAKTPRLKEFRIAHFAFRSVFLGSVFLGFLDDDPAENTNKYGKEEENGRSWSLAVGVYPDISPPPWWVSRASNSGPPDLGARHPTSKERAKSEQRAERATRRMEPLDVASRAPMPYAMPFRRAPSPHSKTHRPLSPAPSLCFTAHTGAANSHLFGQASLFPVLGDGLADV